MAHHPKNNTETLKTLQNRNLYLKMKCFPFGLAIYGKMGGGNFGQSIWDKSVVLLGTYWRTHWELGELFGNLMKNPWELDGNTLGIAKTQNFQTPTSPMAFYVCVCVFTLGPLHTHSMFFYSSLFCVFAFRITIIWHTNLTHIS